MPSDVNPSDRAGAPEERGGKGAGGREGQETETSGWVVVVGGFDDLL